MSSVAMMTSTRFINEIPEGGAEMLAPKSIVAEVADLLPQGDTQEDRPPCKVR
jgi:hypothetical protein